MRSRSGGGHHGVHEVTHASLYYKWELTLFARSVYLCLTYIQKYVVSIVAFFYFLLNDYDLCFCPATVRVQRCLLTSMSKWQTPVIS